MKMFIENTGLHTMYLGGAAIPPGEGREVDVTVSFDRHAPIGFDDLHDLDAAPAVNLGELLKHNVASVAAKLGGLSHTELDDLLALESAGVSPRKGVLEAIAAEKLNRAARENTEG